MQKGRKHVVKEKENAYFTVEAALVFPMVLGVIVLLIYLAFFQYDRCLMEQDMGMLALRGCTIWAEDKEALMQELMEQADKVYMDKYIAWNGSEATIRLEKGTVEVRQEGTLRFPFSSFIGSVEGNWNTMAEYENRRVKPVNFIRLYRKVTGGK